MTTSEGHRLHTPRKWQLIWAKSGLFYLSCTNWCVHSESHMVFCLHSFNLVPTCDPYLRQLQVHAMTQTQAQTSLPRYRCRCKAPPLSCALLCDSYTTSWMLFMGGLQGLHHSQLHKEHRQQYGGKMQDVNPLILQQVDGRATLLVLAKSLPEGLL